MTTDASLLRCPGDCSSRNYANHNQMLTLEDDPVAVMEVCENADAWGELVHSDEVPLWNLTEFVGEHNWMHPARLFLFAQVIESMAKRSSDANKSFEADVVADIHSRGA